MRLWRRSKTVWRVSDPMPFLSTGEETDRAVYAYFDTVRKLGHSPELLAAVDEAEAMFRETGNAGTIVLESRGPSRILDGEMPTTTEESR